tara:strand:+ start:18695 stop:20926 length:2232 start_codon:yes stop_codon:yes gene_type:complete
MAVYEYSYNGVVQEVTNGNFIVSLTVDNNANLPPFKHGYAFTDLQTTYQQFHNYTLVIGSSPDSDFINAAIESAKSYYNKEFFNGGGKITYKGKEYLSPGSPIPNNQLFVLRVRIVSQNPDQVNLGSYVYNTFDLTTSDEVQEQLSQGLEDVFYDSGYGYKIRADIVNENQVDVSMVLDNTKLSGNLLSLRSDVKIKIMSILDKSVPAIADSSTPDKTDYKLIKDQSDGNVNTFIEETNAGGWYILYQLNEIEPEDVIQSGTQSGTQSQSIIEEEAEEILNDDTNDTISEDDGGNINNNKNNSGGEGNIGIENKFPPTIKVEPIEYVAPDEPSVSSDVGKKPFIWFNDMQLNYVESFRMSSSDFLPTIYVIFQDSYGYFDNLRFPNDDDRVRVFIDSKSSLIRPIFIEFKILDFKKLEEGIFSLSGSLNVNKMYVTSIESFKETTSYGVLSKLASLHGLGYSSNISDTNDAMTWINPGNRGMVFCKDVIERSYRSDTSFMWGFVDFFYNLNFIDIETQLNEDSKNQVGVSTSDLAEIKNQLSLVENTKKGFIYLSNDISSHGSPNFFERYKIFNNSTRKSIEEGYNNQVKYYNWKEKSFLIFKTSAITSDKDEDLILKSEDTEFLDINSRHFWEGKMIDNNVHSNFLYANRQNRANLIEVQKIGIEVILPLCNFNLYKFMKIYLLLINQGMKEINPIFNKKLSGEWVIINIEFFMEDGELKQMVRLVRRHLGFSQEEEDSNDT